MTADRDFLEEFLDLLIAKGLHRRIQWICNSRTDADEQLFRKMRQAGCWQIAFGFESGDNRILSLINKGGGCTVEQGRIAAESAHEAGLAVDGHFILGYPGENTHSVQRTIDYACSLPLTFAHFYSATPFPGSVLYRDALEQGWLAGDSWDGVHQGNVSLQSDELRAETVQRLIKKAYFRFYSRPTVIFRALMIPRGVSEYFGLLRSALGFYGRFFKS